jgi:DNA-directed RNA polymerase beta' subunit
VARLLSRISGKKTQERLRTLIIDAMGTARNKRTRAAQKELGDAVSVFATVLVAAYCFAAGVTAYRPVS